MYTIYVYTYIYVYICIYVYSKIHLVLSFVGINENSYFLFDPFLLDFFRYANVFLIYFLIER